VEEERKDQANADRSTDKASLIFPAIVLPVIGQLSNPSRLSERRSKTHALEVNCDFMESERDYSNAWSSYTSMIRTYSSQGR
jgi:hypothetical protein